MFFDETKRVASFDGTVLARVAGENHSASQAQQSRHVVIGGLMACSRKSDSSVLASKPSLRNTSVADAVGAQNRNVCPAWSHAMFSSLSTVVLPVPANPRKPVMRSSLRKT